MCNEDREELLKEGYSKIVFTRMGKIRRFIFHWKNGREDRFPICCIFRFAFEMALADGKTYPLATFPYGSKVRGVTITKRAKCSFIPCGIFHHGTLEKPSRKKRQKLEP